MSKQMVVAGRLPNTSQVRSMAQRVMDSNPNTPNSLRGHWHKLVALLIHKSGAREAWIDSADLAAFQLSGFGSVVVEEVGESVLIRLTTLEEGRRLAGEEGDEPA